MLRDCITLKFDYLKIPLCSLTLLFCLFPQAKLKSLTPEKVTSITVKNFSGTIEFYHKKGPIKLSMTEDIFLKTKSGDIEVRSDLSIEELKMKKNKNKLKVYGSSVPVTLFIQDGDVTLNGWNKNIFISAHKARVNGQKTSGNWQLSTQFISLNLKEHKGSVKLKSFESSIFIKKVEGDLDIQFNEGKLKAKDIKSSLLRFSTHKGQVNINRYKGDIEGFSQEGKVYLSRLTSKKVNIENGKASVYFFYPKKSVKVSAYSEKGKIYAPKHFYKKLSGKSQKAIGWLSGSSGTSRVNLKTDLGNIYIQ